MGQSSASAVCNCVCAADNLLYHRLCQALTIMTAIIPLLNHILFYLKYIMKKLVLLFAVIVAVSLASCTTSPTANPNPEGEVSASASASAVEWVDSTATTDSTQVKQGAKTQDAKEDTTASKKDEEKPQE